MYYLYIAGTVIFTVYGQLILKWRIKKFGDLPDAAIPKIIFLMKIVFDPFVFSGLVAGFVAALFWMASMTKFDLSLAYPLVVASMLTLVTFSGIFLLGEPFTIGKVSGLVLILSGLFLILRIG